MDTEVVGVDQTNKGENLSQKSMNKLDKNYGVVEAKHNATKMRPPSTVAANRVNRAASLGDITPESNREIGDLLLNFTSPVMLVSSTQRAVCFDSHPNDNLCGSINANGGPHTAMDVVFDPFAPGPDNLLLAPHCKKYMGKSRSNVAWRLDFDSSVNFVRDGNCETVDETISEDEKFLEAVYDTLLEAIVSKQTEGLLAEMLPPLDPASDGCKTPDSAPRLSGIAETCPGAPLKPTTKLRNIDDKGLCRKLEF